MRIIIAGLIQESNTFSVAKTNEAYFQNIHLLNDELAQMKGIQSEINGFYLAAAERSDIEILPSFYSHAVSAGKVEEGTYESLKRSLLESVKALLPADGILIALHGAMVAEHIDDVEGNIIESLRGIIGPKIPMAVSLDLHANITNRMIDSSDAIVGFQTYPHVDHTETGSKAARLLFRMVDESLRPAKYFVKLPMIVPAENSQTNQGPMKRLIHEAQEGERRGDVLHTSIFPVQPWLDIDEMGCAIVTVANSQEQAEREAKRIAAIFWDSREQFAATLYGVDEVVQLVREEKRMSPQLSNMEPYVISDSADSSGAGSTGDSTAVLRRLLELKAEHDLRCLLVIVDPEVVATAMHAGVRSTIHCTIGHKLDPRYGEPLQIEAYVRSIGDGIYRYGEGFTTSQRANMGPCTVLDIGTISILVMGQTSFTVDPTMYRSVGLEPKEADMVLVKSANQFRACYEKVSNKCFILDTPGCSTANLRSLVFHKITRPFYPFDDQFEWNKEPSL